MKSLIMLGIAFLVSAAVALASGEEGTGTEDRKPNYRTLGFDNTRFFSPHAGEGWLKISATGKREFIPNINPERTALLLVDLQKGCVAWGNALGSYDKEVGNAFNERMQRVVLPNVEKLIKFFREKEMTIVYLRLGDSDTFPQSIAPDPVRLANRREHIDSKYSPGAFATSSLDNVLCENGIATLITGGVDTAACVLCMITAAHNRTYQVILVDDVCVSRRQELHESVMKIWTYMGFVRVTDQVIQDYPWRSWVYPDKESRPKSDPKL